MGAVVSVDGQHADRQHDRSGKSQAQPAAGSAAAVAGQSAGRVEQIESASEVERQIVAEDHDVVTKLAAVTQN